MRKAWNSYKVKSNFLLEDSLARLKQLNTGICGATRGKYYVQPATASEITNFLDSQLQLLNDSEAGYVTADETPEVVQKTNGSIFFEEEADNE